MVLCDLTYRISVCLLKSVMFDYSKSYVLYLLVWLYVMILINGNCKIEIINKLFSADDYLIYITDDDYYECNHAKLMLNASGNVIGDISDYYDHVISAINELDLIRKLDEYRKNKIWLPKVTPRRKFLIFVYHMTNITLIFHKIREHFIANVILINFNNDTTFVEYQPTSYCNGLTYKNKMYNCNSLDQLHFERHKLLYNCNLNIITSSFLFHNSYAGYSEQIGILLMPILFSTRLYNWSLNVIEPRDFDIEAKYALNEIDNLNGSDFYVAALYRHMILLITFEPSDIVLFDTYIWLIPHLKVPPNIAYLFKVYSPIVWHLFYIGMIIHVFGRSLHSYVMYNKPNIMLHFIYVFHVSLGIPYSRYYKLAPRRIYSITYLLCTYQLLSVYQGKLSSLLLASNHVPIKTFNQLLDTGLNLYMPFALKYIMEVSINEVERDAANNTLPYKSTNLTDAEFVLNNNNNVALLSRRLKTPFKYYTNLTFIYDTLTIKPQMTYFFPNGSHYIPYVNKLICISQENGFISKWVKDILFSNVKFPKYNDDKTLTLTHLNMAFKMLQLGYLMGLFAFVIEIVCYIYKKKGLLKKCLPFRK